MGIRFGNLSQENTGVHNYVLIISDTTINDIIFMAELVRTGKELSDWFPEWSEFSYMDG